LIGHQNEKVRTLRQTLLLRVAVNRMRLRPLMLGIVVKNKGNRSS